MKIQYFPIDIHSNLWKISLFHLPKLSSFRYTERGEIISFLALISNCSVNDSSIKNKALFNAMRSKHLCRPTRRFFFLSFLMQCKAKHLCSSVQFFSLFLFQCSAEQNIYVVCRDVFFLSFSFWKASWIYLCRAWNFIKHPSLLLWNTIVNEYWSMQLQ